MTDLTISAKAIGIKELQTILRESDKKLLRSTQRMMRKAASPMTAQARAITPSQSPLSGWANNGRTGWRQSEVLSGITVKVGGPSLRSNEWALLTLQQNNAAGMIFDWAGRDGMSNRRARSRPYLNKSAGHANTSQGSTMVARLPSFGYLKGSQYSRVLFPAFVATRDEVVRAVQDGVDQVARQLNIEIERI
jgi:hypothetical protein